MGWRSGTLLVLLACLALGLSEVGAQAQRPVREQLKDAKQHMFMSITKSSKLKTGYTIPEGSPPEQPIMETSTSTADSQGHAPVADELERRNGTAKKAPSQQLASFIVQVSSRPAAEAMAQDAATLSVAGARERAQVVAQAVTSEVNRVAASADVTARVVRTYTHALSGLLVKGPTPTQLKALLADPSVVAVWPNIKEKRATFSTPEFLGLTPPSGPHAHPSTAPRQLSGSRRAPGAKAVTNAYDNSAERDEQDGMNEAHLSTNEWEERYPGRQHNRDHHHKDKPRPGYAAAPRHPSVWDQLGGVLGPKGAGEDVVVGIIDDGLWLPDHPSFADSDYWNTSNGNIGQSYNKLSRWNGICQPSGDDSTFQCNNKVIGCRWYNTVWGDDLKEVYPNEIMGCTDTYGHGSHTASTAAGNFGAQAPFVPKGALLSGMAPRARIAVYRVCWGDDCFTSDIIGAYDDAIKDGVDIINYSIGNGGISTSVSIAQMNAAAAGIFVAAAAGNSGPAAGTVDNVGPWVTTAAASHHSRAITSFVSFGNRPAAHLMRVNGSTNPNHAQIGPVPLLYGADAAAPGKSATNAASCVGNSLDPLLVTGAIVICDYDNDGFGRKLTEVQRAGGVAVILAHVKNPGKDAEGVSTLAYVFIGSEQREIAIAQARRVGQVRPMATISAPEFSYDSTAPRMAWFSSRGPTNIEGLLKPDITAPGVAITAAVSPLSTSAYLPGTLYDIWSGELNPIIIQSLKPCQPGMQTETVCVTPSSVTCA